MFLLNSPRRFSSNHGSPLSAFSSCDHNFIPFQVLHTIGGDDTNTQAAELSKYILEQHGGKVVVIGMPKTIDNDVYPIVQTFGADTAAEQGSKFFTNVVSESSANPRMLIIHEVMGRDSGYVSVCCLQFNYYTGC